MASARSDDMPGHLTPVIYHTLLVISAGPAHGYAISQEVAEATAGRVRMGPGTLYGTLQRLSERGWLRPSEGVDADGPHAERRRYYELTSDGWAVLRHETERLARVVELAQERSLLPR